MEQEKLKGRRTSTLGKDQTDQKCDLFDRWFRATVSQYQTLNGLDRADVVAGSRKSTSAFYKLWKQPCRGSVEEIMRILDTVKAEDRFTI